MNGSILIVTAVSLALIAPANAAAPPPDWSKAVVDSTMKRFTPDKPSGWNYTRGLYLYGQSANCGQTASTSRNPSSPCTPRLTTSPTATTKP